MTTTFDAKASSDVNWNNTNTSGSLTGFTAGSSANVFVAYFVLANFATIPSGVGITWGGVTVPIISSQANAEAAGNNGSGIAYIAVLTGGSITGSGKTLSLSWTNAAEGYLDCATFIVTGGSPNIQVATSTSASFGVSNPSIVIPSSSGDIATGSLMTQTGAGSQTMGQTLIYSDTAQTNNGGANYITGSSPTVTLSATLGTMTSWAYVGIDIGTMIPSGRKQLRSYSLIANIKH